MLKTAFKTPIEATKQVYKPVKGDTMTVRKIKESIQKAKRKPVDNPVDNLLKDELIDNRRGLSEERKDKDIDIVYKDNKVNNNDKVITISFDKVLTLVLTHSEKRSRLSEDDISMLERLSNAGVTESELRQALADHQDKSTAALCREVLLAR
jgi:hypothetical protein